MAARYRGVFGFCRGWPATQRCRAACHSTLTFHPCRASQWRSPPAWPAPAGSGAQQAQRLTEERSTPAPPAGSAGEAGEAQPPRLDQQQRRQRCWDSQWQQQWEPGLYYRDAAGLLQGPFTTEQLQGWRGLLPMDLPVLRLTAGSSGGGGGHAAVSGAAAAGGPPDSGGQPERGKGGQVAEGQAAVAQARQGVSGDDVRPPGAAGPGHGSGQQHTPSEEQHQLGDKQRQDAAGKVLQASGQRQLDGAALKEHNDEQQPEETAAQQQGLEPRPGAAEQGVDGVHWEELLLAELLGDGELLDRWRLEYPDQAGSLGSVGREEVSRLGRGSGWDAQHGLLTAWCQWGGA